MNPQENFLITITDGYTLGKIALRVDRDDYDFEVFEYFHEPENKKIIRGILGDLKTEWKIIDVEPILDIVVQK